MAVMHAEWDGNGAMSSMLSFAVSSCDCFVWRSPYISGDVDVKEYYYSIGMD